MESRCDGCPQCLLVILTGLVKQESRRVREKTQRHDEPLKQLSLAELGNVEVTTTSKEPEEVWKTSCRSFRPYPGRHSAVRRHQHPGSPAAGPGS